jgi:hypothetical protein
MRTFPGASGTNSSFSLVSVLKILSAIRRVFNVTDRRAICKPNEAAALAKAWEKA